MSARSQAVVTPRRALTRNRLMAAAMQVFAVKGIAGASVEEICEAAGFTRGAFYSNFDSKDELCFAIIRSLADSALEAVESALAGIGSEPADAVELCDDAVDTFLRSQSNDRASVLLMKEMQLYALRHPEFAPAYQNVLEETHATFAGAIDEALKKQGIEFVIPIREVVEILHAVHQAAQEKSLRLAPQADAVDPNASGDQLKTLLAALLHR